MKFRKLINKYNLSIIIISALLLIVSNNFASISLPKFTNSESSLAPMLKKVIPSVVNIKIFNKHKYLQMLKEQANGQQRMPMSPEPGMIGMGSGVIINAKDGIIVTNNHVVSDADKILITLHDGRNANAKLIGADPKSDLAVLKVNIDGLTELKFADSEKSEVGDFVVAIGSPLGLHQTVTSGIVSGKGRVIGINGLDGYEEFIQTDASINPGNSGGALINLKGELIGINTAILAPDGGSIGIGFAIPSNMSATVIKQILRFGKVRHGLLGVIAQPLTPELAVAFGLPNQKGAVVDTIARDSVAYNSDLKIGDIIYEVSGNSITNAVDLKNTVGLTPIGEEMTFKVIREGKKKSFKIKLVDPDEIQTRAQKIFPALAGAYIDPVANVNIQNVGVVNGLKVLDVIVDSPAWQQGLRDNDIIISANNVKVKSLDELEKAVNSRDKKQPLLLQVAQKNISRFIALKASA